MGRFVHSDYVELTMHFRCNLKCEHCMIEGTMDWLEPESIARLRQVIEYNLRARQWRGLILTGAEITLRKDLPELARLARANGFEHVRIQTHGMRLAEKPYLQELIDAGVDEFFVSVAGSDAATHDAITTVAGSYDKTRRGLENLDAYPHVMVITNTVVTKRSYQLLPGVVEALAHLKRLVQMEFWNYWPMTESDEKDLCVSHLDVLPYLREAIHRAWALGREVEVKNFPECLLGPDRRALDNRQPKLLIDPAFWQEFRRNGFEQCVHRATCGYEHCLGLNSAYIQKFGWQAEALTPFPPRHRSTLPAGDRVALPVVARGV
ncbi:MAG: radical SAM protein [Gemmataceae bacterium]|nr:radical SAM protein [Gemmataceae bacterium]